jgi:hypothetical protein
MGLKGGEGWGRGWDGSGLCSLASTREEFIPRFRDYASCIELEDDVKSSVDDKIM